MPARLETEAGTRRAPDLRSGVTRRGTFSGSLRLTGGDLRVAARPEVLGEIPARDDGLTAAVEMARGRQV